MLVLKIILVLLTLGIAGTTAYYLYDFFILDKNNYTHYPAFLTSISMLLITLTACLVWPGWNGKDADSFGVPLYVALLYFSITTIYLLGLFDERDRSQKKIGIIVIIHQAVLFGLIMIRFCA